MLEYYSKLLMGLYQNKQGDWITPRPPSPYGYYLGDRQGTWCKKCADRYWLYKSYQKSEGTRDEWTLITKENLYNNFECSLCRVVIKDFPRFRFYKRWVCYNQLAYIWKDSTEYLYKLIANIFSSNKTR